MWRVRQFEYLWFVVDGGTIEEEAVSLAAILVDRQLLHGNWIIHGDGVLWEFGLGG